ncbi:hypothetical protein [Domibacillus sp. A3M-37]|uniref:hypothetical protein n=1 Tax=Domibacillus sp. A3M-37 TaxID=2962037 RepID=UPI0028121AF1|nr:hypothetical protein [Domibacillus sp. A3M-37]
MYFATAPSEAGHPEHKTFQHRMYAIENDNENPLEGEWIEKRAGKSELVIFLSGRNCI